MSEDFVQQRFTVPDDVEVIPLHGTFMAVDVVTGGSHRVLERYDSGRLIERREWFEPNMEEDA
jgi:hypothetical protein